MPNMQNSIRSGILSYQASLPCYLLVLIETFFLSVIIGHVSSSLLVGIAIFLAITLFLSRIPLLKNIFIYFFSGAWALTAGGIVYQFSLEYEANMNIIFSILISTFIAFCIYLCFYRIHKIGFK